MKNIKQYYDRHNNVLYLYYVRMYLYKTHYPKDVFILYFYSTYSV